MISKTATITLYTRELNKQTNIRYELILNQVVLHEIGHALGLEHTTANKNAIMYPTTYSKNTNIIDLNHVAIDQDYINGLAILYQN